MPSWNCLDLVSQCVVEASVADQTAAEGEEGFVHVGAAFVADEESFHLVQPAEGALDDPAAGAKTGAVTVVAVGDQRRDPTFEERLAEPLGVVAAVAEHDPRTPARPAGTAANRRHAVEQGQELRDVVLVAGRQRPGQRRPVRVGQEVVF